MYVGPTGRQVSASIGKLPLRFPLFASVGLLESLGRGYRMQCHVQCNLNMNACLLQNECTADSLTFNSSCLYSL